MLTRRAFIAQLATSGATMAATAVPIPVCVLRALSRAKVAVVSIHMDQPYLDRSGRALPYLPPAGLRAGAPVADLNETEFRRRFVYL